MRINMVGVITIGLGCPFVSDASGFVLSIPLYAEHLFNFLSLRKVYRKYRRRERVRESSRNTLTACFRIYATQNSKEELIFFLMSPVLTLTELL